MIKDLYIGEKITMSTLKKDESQTSDNKPKSVDALALKKKSSNCLKITVPTDVNSATNKVNDIYYSFTDDGIVVMLDNDRLYEQRSNPKNFKELKADLGALEKAMCKLLSKKKDQLDLIPTLMEARGCAFNDAVTDIYKQNIDEYDPDKVEQLFNNLEPDLNHINKLHRNCATGYFNIIKLLTLIRVKLSQASASINVKITDEAEILTKTTQITRRVGELMKSEADAITNDDKIFSQYVDLLVNTKK